MPTVIDRLNYYITANKKAGLPSNVSVLYHGTKLDSAMDIINGDRIDARTDQSEWSKSAQLPTRKRDANKNEIDPIHMKSRHMRGVSLTRDLEFASAYTNNAGIVFALNADKLRQNYRLLLIDYWGNRTEKEEFVIGPINNLSKYLIAIYINYQGYRECSHINQINAHKPYEVLLSHPLLKIIEFPKHRRYHDLNTGIPYGQSFTDT